MHIEERVRRFGDGDLIAFSTLQPGLDRFETSFGVWTYRRVHGMDVTLGGPLCDASDRLAMIERFLSRARRPILCYLRDDLMRLLDGAGLHAAGMGVDRHVDVARLSSDPPKPVRGALKKAAKAGLRIAPMSLEDLSLATRARLESIQARYLANAECTIEMSFINRPMSYVPDGMRRVYTLETDADGLFGFAVLNPIFDSGRVHAYLLDILRFAPTKLWGVWLSTVYRLAEGLQAEGVGLSVGFAPLHRLRRPPGASRLACAQMEGMARLVGSAQYLRRLRELKDLIPGPEEPRSFASFSRSALVNLFAFMEASGVGFRYLFGPDLIPVLKRGMRDLVGMSA